jgi:hypothetical protein
VAGYESSDLLAWFNRLAGRPDSDALTDPVKYQWLADAQQSVVSRIAAIIPRVLYGAPALLTTADSGKTFTFGTDTNGDAITPMGKVGIYTSLESVPDSPWVEGVDYLAEGVRIRIPGNQAYAGSLYWRGITPPVDLSASVEPVLQPPPARELIVLKAVQDFAESAEQDLTLAAAMHGRFTLAFASWMLTYRTQYRSGGVLAPLTSSSSSALGVL